MNTLTQPLIRLAFRDSTVIVATVPGALAALMRDDVTSFPALRPHQRHAWHAFLAQIGALALLRGELRKPPTDEETWRDLLRGLTSGHADDAPWCLVAPYDRPALLQPPVPRGDLPGLKNIVMTPDGLDMLVTSKNHDLKSAVMDTAAPDDWLFALVTLQTMEGFLGAGNYGISRMNGGFANRPALGLAPPGGPGAHLRRDIHRLLAMHGGPPLSEGYAERDGLALIWLRPWDGAVSLSRLELDPLYVEVCRRVRLVETAGQIVARSGGSKVPRVAPALDGITGDPWTPIRRDKDGQKALTVDGRGFGYRPLVGLLFPRNGDPSPLQEPAADDVTEGLTLVARALVRGQGKTEGYHERRVPLSRRVRRGSMGGTRSSDPVAQAAHERVELAGEMAGALRFALLSLFENGPDKVDRNKDSAQRKARLFLDRYEREVDLRFFEALRLEVDEDDAETRHARRAEWVQGLLALSGALLAEADRAASKATFRRYRARVNAQAALHGGARRSERLRGYLPQAKPKETPHAAP